jgi:hypothetical protein
MVKAALALGIGATGRDKRAIGNSKVLTIGKRGLAVLEGVAAQVRNWLG